MSKKMKLIPFLFKNKETQWPWRPSCKQCPKTISFRLGDQDDVFKTVNSIYLHDQPKCNVEAEAEVETPVSWFTSSCESTTTTTDQSDDHESLETVLISRGVQSERLFFEPNQNKSPSIINKLEEKSKSSLTLPISADKDEESMVMVAIESEDPYRDFKTSMEEMVECYKMKEWECLEELLAWYLKVNGKKNHGFIVGAFLDLLVGEKSTSSTTTIQDSCLSSDYSTSNYSTALSSFPSPDLSSFSSSASPFCPLSEVENFEIDDQDE